MNTQTAPASITAQIEPTPIAPEHLLRLKRLCADIERRPSLNRAEVSNLVLQEGFAAYVGGCHVAIHRKRTTGQIVGPRIALVTGSTADWN